MSARQPAATQFIYAASKNDLEIVKENIDYTGRQTINTAFLCACVNGHLAVVKLLISHGAAIDYNPDTDWTALHRAAFRAQSRWRYRKSWVRFPWSTGGKTHFCSPWE